MIIQLIAVIFLTSISSGCYMFKVVLLTKHLLENQNYAKNVLSFLAAKQKAVP